MRRCGFTYPWDSPYRCHKRTVTGTCVAHRLWSMRWQREGRDHWVTWTADLSNINRPYLMVDDDRQLAGRLPRWASFQYGNGNSDPVLSLTVQVPDDYTKSAWCGLGLVGILGAMVGRRKLIARAARPRPSCLRRRDR